jgi:hypothetical protein
VAVADALPEYDVRAVHAIVVDAPPERALAAARAVTAREAPLLQMLFTLRGLRAPADRPIWEAMAQLFVPFDDTTLVAIERPWQPRGAWRRRRDTMLQEAFARFAEPGWAKLAIG